MGTCVSRCLQPWLEPRNFRPFSAHYSEHQLSIEVDALLLDDSDDDIPLAQLTRTRTTDQESRDSRQKRNERSHEMESEKERRLAKEEEDRRLEEEAYYEATKAAARATELAKEREKAEQTLRDLGNSSQPVFTVTGGASLGDWSTEPDGVGGGNAGGTGGSAQQELEDFELFLQSVKERSLSQRSLDRVRDSAGSGLDFLGDSSGRNDNFTLFEDSVMPTTTTAQ